ncbi:TPA: hypothetical protein ACH3X1_014814 [Trebouxia sp. C0004]
MPLGGNLTLEKLWLAWEPKEQGRGCEGLRIYKAESPDLYPSDQARRHQMRWLRQGDGNRFDQFRQVFLTMDRLVRKKNSSNRKRDATTIISSWRRSPFSSPQCPINTVAGLAVALKAVCQWRQADLWCVGGAEAQGRWYIDQGDHAREAPVFLSIGLMYSQQAVLDSRSIDNLKQHTLLPWAALPA